MPKHKKTLVLNADYSAIGLISYEKAIVLEIKGRIYNVDFYTDDHIIGTRGKKWPVPAVVALIDYVSPSKRTVPFSRKNVFIRDKMKCQYCGKKCSAKELTYDHVIPRSRWSHKKGTPTKWENIVASCVPCNNKKADLTLEQAGMRLIRHPHQPSPVGYVLGLAPWTNIEKEWEPYIPKSYLEYCQTIRENYDETEENAVENLL